MSSPEFIPDPTRPAPRQPPRPQGLAFALSIIVLVMYSGFVLLVGFARPFLGTLVVPGVPGLSWGILLGALVIIVAWLLTLIYVAASNKNTSGR